MHQDEFLKELERALHVVTQADKILQEATEAEQDDIGDGVPPWVAAHYWIFRSMCLLIDSLEGVERTTFSDDENVPVSETQQPYDYLSREHQTLSDKYSVMAHFHEAEMGPSVSRSA